MRLPFFLFVGSVTGWDICVIALTPLNQQQEKVRAHRYLRQDCKIAIVQKHQKSFLSGTSLNFGMFKQSISNQK